MYRNYLSWIRCITTLATTKTVIVCIYYEPEASHTKRSKAIIPKKDPTPRKTEATKPRESSMAIVDVLAFFICTWYTKKIHVVTKPEAKKNTERFGYLEISTGLL